MNLLISCLLLYTQLIKTQDIPEDQMKIYLMGSGIQYAGTWFSKKNINQFDFLTESEGDSFMIFLSENSETKTSSVINELKMQLLNPKYSERKYVMAQMMLNNYDPKKYSWKGVSQTNYTGYDSFKIKIAFSCLIDYEVKVVMDKTNVKQINLSIKSTEEQKCNIDLSIVFKLDTKNYQLQVVMYSLYVMLMCIIQFICIIKICKRIIDTDQNPSQISLVTVCFITIYDGCLSAQNLMYGLILYPYFSYFVMCAFFLFILSTSCDMKLVWLIWRARVQDPFQEDIRRQLTKFFFKFYSGLIIYFVLNFFLQFNLWFESLNALFMVPQIVQYFQYGQKFNLDMYYLFGVLGVKLFYPLYFRSCPENFPGYEPSLQFTIALIVIYSFQLGVLVIQSVFGPKSIIPKWFLPQPYNYFSKVFDENIEAENECCICLHSLDEDPDESQLQINLLQKRIMGTPCGHRFHTQCLCNWMRVKLQCPACRSSIPPLV